TLEDCKDDSPDSTVTVHTVAAASELSLRRLVKPKIEVNNEESAEEEQMVSFPQAYVNQTRDWIANLEETIVQKEVELERRDAEFAVVKEGLMAQLEQYRCEMAERPTNEGNLNTNMEVEIAKKVVAIKVEPLREEVEDTRKLNKELEGNAESLHIYVRRLEKDRADAKQRSIEMEKEKEEAVKAKEKMEMENMKMAVEVANLQAKVEELRERLELGTEILRSTSSENHFGAMEALENRLRDAEKARRAAVLQVMEWRPKYQEALSTCDELARSRAPDREKIKSLEQSLSRKRE
ncbi:hypothetical protein PFISCL1PPCAC_6652, partial [Pristionchus fissidentatus]